MNKTFFLAAAASLCLILCGCSKTEINSNLSQNSANSENSITQNNSDNDVQNINSNAANYNIYVKNYSTPAQTSIIDSNVDCKKIVLNSANALKNMISDYYNSDANKLTFKTQDNSNGDFDFAKIVVSENFNSYSDFKKLFDNSVYEKYIDLINYSGNGFREKDGVLYYSDYVNGGNRGTAETWCVGYDTEEGRIIGHFAELKADIASPETVTAEFLNDVNNYRFYDIIIQNIDDNYVVTNCADSENNQCFSEHGLCYNSGFADRSLITNPEVLPID